MFANADVYAPDDAAQDANGNVIRTTQAVYRVSEQHPGPNAVGRPANPWVAVAVLGLGAYLWARFHR